MILLKIELKEILVKEYSNTFNDGRTQYKINISDELESEMNTLYSEFSKWLSSWEL